MRLPTTLSLALLLGLGTVARANPHSGTESYDVTVAESRLADGVTYTLVRDGNPNDPFELVEDGEEIDPVQVRGVVSAPDGIEVSFSGSSFTLQGSGSGTVVLETQFRDVEVHVDVDQAPSCETPPRKIVGLGQRDVLVDAADLCIDPEGIIPVVTEVTGADGSELDVTYNADGTATLHLAEEGEGDTQVAFKVADDHNGIGHGEFTITTRDWDPIFRVASGGETTFSPDDLAEDLATKEDPLSPVSVEVVDEEEVLAVDCCGGGEFTVTTRDDFDIWFLPPTVEGTFEDADGALVEATWELEYNEVATCEEGEVAVAPKELQATLSLADFCVDPEGDQLTVEEVLVDGKIAKYGYNADTSELTVYLPYAKEVGGTFKIQAKVGNNGGRRGYDPIKEGTFTIVFRDDF